VRAVLSQLVCPFVRVPVVAMLAGLLRQTASVCFGLLCHADLQCTVCAYM